jgi:hypothetical protein
MEGLRVRVQHVNGRTEELTVESDRVLIGSGAHCEVRLPLDQARFEHVLVRASPAGLFASARAVDPPPTLNGAEFTEAPMLAGSVLRIKQSTVEIEPISLDVQSSDANKKGGRANLRPALILAFGIAAALAMIAAKPRAKAGLGKAPQVPELFAQDWGLCPKKDAQQAQGLAESKVRSATVKGERGPFYPEDGIAAVALFQTASACFRVAQRDEDADRAAHDAGRLRNDLGAQFRVHRMRLDYALRSEDWELALLQVRILRGFVAGNDEASGSPASLTAYANWLAQVGHQLELKHSGKKKK